MTSETDMFSVADGMWTTTQQTSHRLEDRSTNVPCGNNGKGTQTCNCFAAIIHVIGNKRGLNVNCVESAEFWAEARPTHYVKSRHLFTV